MIVVIWDVNSKPFSDSKFLTGNFYVLFSVFFLSLNTARPSFKYYQQEYFVHSGLQDESLQVTISKLP